ncbi:uncharacterized protein TRUGW13939_06752 [Talaromyces rugulosus]|uniref:Zn(2)-C6 fungal-type domain-containing protein n=1 Tax=Talaromyces rugulosus TaxID=121627 RepID=A0A7H8R1H5_TALRU|nr:uncharacterized protein TRUGW13939_06752 [Talaromyces rugulosus]QKX59615.1 hypothetical protein TRUGW13939_06752 [Talaromyces rugulosus]
MASNNDDSSPVRLSRNRKSRGRGLRTTTGCSICRKRHLKCDEVKPVCGPCKKINRSCSYVQQTHRPSSCESVATKSPHDLFEAGAADVSQGISDAQPFSELNDGAAFSPWTTPHEQPQKEQHAETMAVPPWNEDNRENASTLGMQPLEHLAAIVAASHHQSTQNTSHSMSAGSVTSPGPTINAATVRWFDLLAHDAVRESPQAATIPGLEHDWSFLDRTEQADSAQTTPLERATRIVDGQRPDDDGTTRSDTSPPGLTPVASNSYEEQLWKAPRQIQLLPKEFFFFENFVRRVSQWIDLFDPTSKFSTFVPHLAMRNAGLLNAILALSCRHLSLNPNLAGDELPYREISLQYYYQTLHYVQKAMQYSSYKISLELLATTLIISTYEMLSDSPTDWERHLEGVFLIQRSQVIQGESEGLKCAVWWAWLCQDFWAAFREKRRTLTFWTPKKSYESLTPYELASRSVYITAKVINYCSQEESSITGINIHARLDRANQLRDMLDEWRSHLTIEFYPLPAMTHDSSAVFRSIWIRTPAFGVAVQLHCAARILLSAHEPCIGGFDEYAQRQSTIKQCAEIICGIAMTQKDEASNLMSSQCLFIAGIFVSEARARECVLEMLDSRRQQTGWPVNPLGDELKQLWMRYETPRPLGQVGMGSPF